MSQFQLDDGRVVQVSEDASDLRVFERGWGKQEILVRRHRWWGPPSEWRVATRRPALFGFLDLGWVGEVL